MKEKIKSYIKKTAACAVSISAMLTVSCWGNFDDVYSTVDKDTTPADEVTIGELTAGGNKVILNWAEPSDPGFDHVKVTWAPEGETGTTLTKGTTTYTITGLTNGTEYTITLHTVDKSGNESTGNVLKITPPASLVLIHYIYTADELNAVRTNLSHYYMLKADIDLASYSSGAGWVPIGDNTNKFTGTFEGNGHVISGLKINRTTSDSRRFLAALRVH